MAFAALGPDALQFLMETEEGKKYLKLLLKLHFCPGQTFFTNLLWPKNNSGDRRTSSNKHNIIKGQIKQTLATLVKPTEDGPKHTVSITRYNCIITMAVNGSPVVEQDIRGIDAVAQALGDILLPGDIVGKGPQDAISKIKIAFGPFL